MTEASSASSSCRISRPDLLRDPLVARLAAAEPVAWTNPGRLSAAEALAAAPLTAADIDAAAARLRRFAPLLAELFPETRPSGGIVESPLIAAPALQAALDDRYGRPLPGPLLLKRDDALPISGSVKARGGVYEVLWYAEQVAEQAGLLHPDDDYRVLLTPPVRAVLASHRIVVGSTGNLGLSIGIMGAKLGLHVTVHMSADAREWKKQRLRAEGVEVIEHRADYSVAVAAGREAAASDPDCHFIDDESSRHLFLGYAVAARRLAGQLRALDVPVDAEHPLQVTVPCGVGGAAGGITFGLATELGDDVRCLFAEPTHSPCLLLGLHTGLNERISVQDIGLDNRTAADGLAVGRASALVGQAAGPLLDGGATVPDDEMFRLAAILHRTEGIGVEPSAAAGLPVPYRFADRPAGAHVVWLTGGRLVPEEVMAGYLRRGERLL
jgi:D-serine dehydratase